MIRPFQESLFTLFFPTPTEALSDLHTSLSAAALVRLTLNSLITLFHSAAPLCDSRPACPADAQNNLAPADLLSARAAVRRKRHSEEQPAADSLRPASSPAVAPLSHQPVPPWDKGNSTIAMGPAGSGLTWINVLYNRGLWCGSTVKPVISADGLRITCGRSA
ncbi:hypothetical protein SKAU_G00005230 [Synaphobranchus kaupii]|uniref:Uncharacterized protein n=1 Tax=Synaphobranchus kaupii TaxID=118154 RepID=A0A9Q1G8Z7_SYNKA|nr:hypothetical protein SKAU_G00005230 [Synaphobranchus kaupii]